MVETGCLAGIPCLRNDKELSREPVTEWRVLDAPIVDDPCFERRATLRRFGQGCPAVEKRIMPVVAGHGFDPLATVFLCHPSFPGVLDPGFDRHGYGLRPVSRVYRSR